VKYILWMFILQKTPPAAAVDQKRVSISSSVPKIIRNSAETLSEDDEISFKTPEVSPKVTYVTF